MEALSRWVARHRLVVGLAPSVSRRLSSGASPNGAAYTANLRIAEQYGGSASNPGVVVIDLPTGVTISSPGVSSQLRTLDGQVAQVAPGLREISYASTGNPALVSGGGRSTILLVCPPTAGHDLPVTVLDQLSVAAKTAVPGASVTSTGLGALASGSGSTASSRVLAELWSVRWAR